MTSAAASWRRRVAMRVVRFLAKEPVMSLLDNDEDTWRVRGGRRQRLAVAALLVTRYRQVADLAEAGGWEAEYPRDVWQMRRLGFDGDRTLRFDRDLRSRGCGNWPNGGCGGGCRPGWAWKPAAARPVVAITRFARFLAEVGVERIDQVDRRLLERYLADLGRERHRPAPRQPTSDC